MKISIALIMSFVIVKAAFAQCEMPYVSNAFTKIEYYTNSNGKLKLLKTTYSKNTFEITKNTRGTEGDLFSLIGNFGKYVEFIKEYECSYESNYTNYKFHVGNGMNDDVWLVTILKNGTIFKATNIRASENLLIEFIN